MIDVKHLSKSFGEVEVLKDINETIDKGEKVVIVGPSGSGKSTFLRCLNLMEKPTSGDIFFEGENITQANEHEMNKLRQRMGMVFQHFNLFPHLTIKKNITLAPVKLGLMTADEADKKAEELLERVGLPDKADEYPSRLSGGQKQRIAIARSLAMNPEVMLFDELYDKKTSRTLMYGIGYDVLYKFQKQQIKVINEQGIFQPPHDFEHLRKCADKYISQGVKMGEGWLITAEMAALAETGTKNIICTQPFGCLPNHIVAKGMSRTIKQAYPDANIVAIDYDPGATKVNQENRIKLMLANAVMD